MNFKVRDIYFTINFSAAAGLCILLGLKNSSAVLAAAVCALAHEFSHIICLTAFGERPKAVKIYIFGIKIERRKPDRLSYFKEGIVSFAGPLINLALYISLSAAGYFFKYKGLQPYIMTNLAFFIFNLLPIRPLDGGRGLYHLLAAKRPEETARKITDLAGYAVLPPLSFAGFLLLVAGGYNFTLLAVCVYLVFLIFVKTD